MAQALDAHTTLGRRTVTAPAPYGATTISGKTCGGAGPEAPQHFDRWVARRPLNPASVLFGFTDRPAVGALHALHEHGLRAPEDAAAVGIDGSGEGRYSTPSSTGIPPGEEDIARRAPALLVDRIEGGEQDGVDYAPSFSLVVRNSAPSSPWTLVRR